MKILTFEDKFLWIQLFWWMAFFSSEKTGTLTNLNFRGDFRKNKSLNKNQNSKREQTLRHITKKKNNPCLYKCQLYKKLLGSFKNKINLSN